MAPTAMMLPDVRAERERRCHTMPDDTSVGRTVGGLLVWCPPIFGADAASVPISLDDAEDD